MLYTQFRENERTTRYEVKLVPGHRCQLTPPQSIPVSADERAFAGDRLSAAKAKKSVSAATTRMSNHTVAADNGTYLTGPEWSIGSRDEATWVDLEAELTRLRERSAIDLGLGSGTATIVTKVHTASGELSSRLKRVSEELYTSDTPEDYLSYLGLLNILEYFRLIAQSKRSEAEAGNAKQVGIVGQEYFTCRRVAFELDIAELTEWLVAHGVGIPDLSVFYPEEYKSESLPASNDSASAAEAPKKRGRKKAGETTIRMTDHADEGATTESQLSEPAVLKTIPDGVRAVVELIRLHQASTSDLLHFVDEIVSRGGLATPAEAIALLQQRVPWIDAQSFEAQYHSMKHERAMETERQQASLHRQREIFDKKPKRGLKSKPALRITDQPRSASEKRELELKKREHRADERASDETVISPLDEFASSFDEDPETAYERAMEMALDRPTGMEFVPMDFANQDEEGQQDHHESEESGDEVEDGDHELHINRTEEGGTNLVYEDDESFDYRDNADASEFDANQKPDERSSADGPQLRLSRSSGELGGHEGQHELKFERSGSQEQTTDDRSSDDRLSLEGLPRPGKKRRRKNKRAGDRPFPTDRGFPEDRSYDRQLSSERPHHSRMNDHPAGMQNGRSEHPRPPRQEARGSKPHAPRQSRSGSRNHPRPTDERSFVGGEQRGRQERAPRQGGSRQPRVSNQPNFDEIQPASNYSPGLIVPATSSAAPGGKKKWRK